jgi:tRNA modification GTPase
MIGQGMFFSLTTLLDILKDIVNHIKPGDKEKQHHQDHPEKSVQHCAQSLRQRYVFLNAFRFKHRANSLRIITMSTIVALATPAGCAALSIIRASGPDCGKIFSDLTPRVATLKSYVSQNGTHLDDIVVVFYKGPASYTGEDAFELTCHGNQLIVKEIIDDLIARGFEMAGPGEFTRRAFLNGKLDLTQAEAVAEVISARSQKALAAAHRLLAGDLGRAMTNFSDRLLNLLALVEAYIDFPEEGLPPQAPIDKELNVLTHELETLKSTQDAHRLTHDGARVAIVGATNAGKSSLFNALLGHDRALVSSEAGTTRDYIEAPLILDGNYFQLIDTAGLNETPGQIEAMGIARTQDQMATADIVLWVVDATDNKIQRFPKEIEPDRIIKVYNKIDLAPKIKSTQNTHNDYVTVFSSAATGQGIEGIKGELLKKLAALLPKQSDALMVSARHAEALKAVLRELGEAQNLNLEKSSPELIAHHLRQAVDFLEEILGKFDNEQVLDRLFSHFCIGK